MAYKKRSRARISPSPDPVPTKVRKVVDDSDLGSATVEEGVPGSGQDDRVLRYTLQHSLPHRKRGLTVGFLSEKDDGEDVGLDGPSNNAVEVAAEGERGSVQASSAENVADHASERHVVLLPGALSHTC